MQATRHTHHLEWELIKWLAIISLAAALAIGATARIAGGQQADDGQPGLLPPEIDRWAQPMDRYSYDSEDHPSQDVSQRLWLILEDQRSGRMDLAVESWKQIPLPGQSKVWRHVAMAQAYLAMGELDNAAVALQEAEQHEGNNALVYYYTAMLRMKQAEKAPLWYDAPLNRNIRLAAQRPPRVAPNTPGMYRLAAMMHLTKAIEFAPLVPNDQPLVPEAWPTTMALGPTVGDLLLALGDERFEGQAHYALGEMHMENGAVHQAEYHLDQANQLGVPIRQAFGDLGRLYQQQQQHLDAFRAFLKDSRQGRGAVSSIHDAFENLRKAVVEEIE